MASHARVATELGSASDSELIELLGQRTRRRVGIGGATQAIQIAGEPVFVKLVRVTDRELAAGSGCMANLFDLPTWYQYGVGEGSTGFNVWREVAANQLASNWVLNGVATFIPHLRNQHVPCTAGTSPGGRPRIGIWIGRSRMHCLTQSVR